MSASGKCFKKKTEIGQAIQVDGVSTGCYFRQGDLGSLSEEKTFESRIVKIKVEGKNILAERNNSLKVPMARMAIVTGLDWSE